MHWKPFAVATLALSGALMFGCAEKFTRDRFEMITVESDDEEDVEHKLGKPASRMDDEWYYENFDKHYAARVFFDEHGRVRGKEWMDARTGEWSGKHPDAQDPPEGEVRERHTRTRRIDPD